MKCERCGATTEDKPWPKGWVQSGRSRHKDAPLGIASWCHACSYVMPAGSLDIVRRAGRTNEPEYERIILPLRHAEYSEPDVLILPMVEA